MTNKTVMREVVIKICDYCGKEIGDNSWTGGNGTDFHDMKVGGELGEIKETCYEKHKRENLEARSCKDTNVSGGDE